MFCEDHQVFQVAVYCFVTRLTYCNLSEHLSPRLLPESVEWLCANNRIAEAERIIRNAAKLNNITMPDKILAGSGTGDGDKADDPDRKKGNALMEKLRNLRKKKEKKKEGDARYTVIDIFRNRRLVINTLCMSFCWSVNPLVHKVAKMVT